MSTTKFTGDFWTIVIERQKVAKKGQLSMSLVQPTNINQNEAL